MSEQEPAVRIDYNGKAPESVFVSVCVRKHFLKRAVHVIIGQGPDRGRAGQPADGPRERDIYLELQSARLWGGVRYCSRA